ncbi:hypothetical protein G6F35_013051 [Rhizopus arrhizus]|nr:hypothetical protein G6F35_013051 [Rhizopus arrhizus]
MEARTAELARKTNETDIKVAINLDDKMNQKININTGIGFLDHSVNFYWGTKLWGLATKNDELVKLANLQLAVTKRTAYEYFWMLDGNKNRPAEMVKNKVAGIYFEQKVDYTTYFGRYLEYIHGIQQLPMTPMLGYYIRTPEFVGFMIL